MNKKVSEDEVITISNPRLLSACYFSLLSIIAIFFFDAIFSFKLYLIPPLPIAHALEIGAVISAIFGAIFGEMIVHAKRPFKIKTFWSGFFIVIFSVPIYTLTAILLVTYFNPVIFVHESFKFILETYALILFYSYIYFGIWFAILSGLAAIYLRGVLVYYCLRSVDD